MNIQVPVRPIPPLQAGDRLTHEEFVRRYEAMPEKVKAELISGVVYMASPVNPSFHGRPHAEVIAWLAYYLSVTPELLLINDGTMRLGDDSEPQPDVALCLPLHAGGRVEFPESGYYRGVPELIVEVAATSVNYDLHEKRALYQQIGVREYIVWRVYDDAIDWFDLEDGQYVLQVPEQGILRSRTFPGLTLEPAVLMTSDCPAIFASVQRGIAASPDHAAFVSRLRQT